MDENSPRPARPDEQPVLEGILRRASLAAPDYRDQLPEIVSLGAFKNSPFACWDQRPGEIGSDAALLLAGMMRHNETGVPDSPRTSMVQGAFNDAAPLAPAEPAPSPRLRPSRCASQGRQGWLDNKASELNP